MLPVVALVADIGARCDQRCRGEQFASPAASRYCLRWEIAMKRLALAAVLLITFAVPSRAGRACGMATS